MKKFLLITCSLVCLVFVAQAQKKVLDKVVAQIGGNPILLSELNQQYTLYLNQGNPDNPTVKCYILQQMLAQKLLKQQAEIDSIVVEEADIDNELDKRMRYQIQRAGGQENLERVLGRSALQYKDELRPEIREQLISNKMQGEITKNVTITPLEVRRYFETYKKDSLPDI
ncbi:MAG: peptidylprolyl isomerase, partial [Pedobacter sp.]